MSGLEPGAVKKRIDGLCAVWLHKPTGKRYYIAHTAFGMHELHGLDDGVKYINVADLDDAEVWSKQT